MTSRRKSLTLVLGMATVLLALGFGPLHADDASKTSATPDPAKDMDAYALWITGEAITKDGLLLFRTDKPVKGNSEGNLVLLGASTDAAKFLLPLYAKAAEKHVPLRLYGVLLPAPKLDGHAGPIPSVEFITWKVHDPSDPDKLPPGQAVPIVPGSSPTFTNADGTPAPPMRVEVIPQAKPK